MLRTPPAAGEHRAVRRLRLRLPLPVRLRMPRVAASGVVAFLLALLSSAPAPASATAEPAPAPVPAAAAQGPLAQGPRTQGPSVQGSSESLTLEDPRTVAHFDFAAGQTPENIALEPDGSADLTFALARQVARVDPHGNTRVLAELPAVADPQTPLVGAAVVSGIVRTHDGTLYVAYNTGTTETGVYRITPDGTVAKFADLPPDGFANGLALDEKHGALYAADSVLGAVRRISLGDASVTAWATGTALAPTTFIGANGIKVHHQAVWVSNYDRGTLLRIPVGADGSAGAITTRADGLDGIDDFAFAGRSETVLAALNPGNELVLVRRDGTRTVLLTARDGLSGPTSVAVRRHTVYVPSASFTTEQPDPNLLIARVADAEKDGKDAKHAKDGPGRGGHGARGDRG
ncbi:hypothetical protein ABZ128_29285 [Streptomyces sp. NPDC006326]|uniref:hypothetical protein n=1 Tax=Streptomyces sp. NPDC006326 TaxID=3156752 RepID=UPI0033BA2455